MDKLGDMDLFMRVVKHGGLASAGREVGLSPASMSMRINKLEANYGVRLLHRTTRRVSMTGEGKRFYVACERVLAEVAQAEAELQSGSVGLTGPLRVTCTSDLGQQHILPVLNAFAQSHPMVRPNLYLTDGVSNLIEDGFDLAIRYGQLNDSSMVAQRLAASRRVLCASPTYLKHRGTLKTPEELADHDCLTMVRATEPMTTWYFRAPNTDRSIAVSVESARASNDGTVVRRWAVEGAGIALKSIWDIQADLQANRLVTLFDNYEQDFERLPAAGAADLHVIYPNREFLPQRTRRLIEALRSYFAENS